MKARIRLFLALFILSLLAIWSRLFYWQVISAAKLSALAQKQRLTITSIEAPRGLIYSDDEFPLVLNKPVYSFHVYFPNLDIDRKTLADKLIPILSSEVKEGTESAEIQIAENLNQKLNTDRDWILIKNRVSEKIKEDIETLEFAGLGFTKKEIRDYPEASMSAHLLGFVGKDETGNPTGYFGLEGFYQEQLTGSPGLKMQEQGLLGNIISFGGQSQELMSPGLNLILYLQRPAQYFLETELKKGIKKYGAASGWGIILDPENEAVLAMASFPSYDPAQYQNYPASLYPNPVIATGFEPGSIFKPLIMAAALEEKKVTPDTKCPRCDGPRKIADHTIRTWNDKYFPETTMAEIIEHSDNVGMVYVSEQLGKNNILKYLKKYGFGQKTGIDLQEEAKFPLRSAKQWYPIDLASVSFGQGILVTPLQIIHAFNALTPQGKITNPKVVKEIRSENNKNYPIKKKPGQQILSKKTRDQIKDMLINVVENGSAKWTKSDRLVVAGKTGTAQIAVRGKYAENKTLASFIGFAPADNPKFIMLISLKEPTVSPWGAETAAPIWFNIAERLAYYWNLL